MTDHLVHLPEHYQYVYQFQPGHSNERCAEACMSMVAQIAFPGRFANPAELMHELYEQYVGPDVPTNKDGTTKESVLHWLSQIGIGHIDMSHLLGDLDNLKAEIQAQNLQSVCQIVTIDDMSKLRYAANGGKLYDWAAGGVGVSHVILRVGFSDDHGYGLYFDPAASPKLPHPLPIAWDHVVEAGIRWVCAIMPYHVDVPPVGFSYQHGSWPPPAPAVNLENAASTVHAMLGAVDQLNQVLSALKNAGHTVLSDLGKL